jgi:hypothetical protein
VFASLLDKLAALSFTEQGAKEELRWRSQKLEALGTLAAPSRRSVLVLQLRFILTSESMGDHDSEDHGWREHRLKRRLNYGRLLCGT